MTKTKKTAAEDLPALFARCWSGTLEELAAQSGWSLGSCWNWKTGTRTPSPAAMPTLAALLGCSLDELEDAARLSEDERRGRRADAILLADASRVLRSLATRRVRSADGERELRAAALLLARECRAAAGVGS